MNGYRRSGKKGWRKATIAAFFAGILVLAGTQLAITKTDNGAFCGNCHVMSEAVWTHQQSLHAKFACNDCHTPHAIVPKLPYKAQIGLHDIIVNTFMDVPDVIHSTTTMKDVVKQNCVRCHYASVQEVNMDVKPYCTDCHRSVPHMNKLPIDKRKAADV